MNGSRVLKEKYFKFFEKHNHKKIDSASLIPGNDSSVLFITAGMQPLAPFLLGQEHTLGKRIVGIQKCLRTVDFDNIGDNSHHTFFQMLGNWSFGDYFKEESIKMSFEFLTSKEWLNLPIEKLAFTVYEGGEAIERDEESANFWKALEVSEKRIVYLGKDNFWSAGETGPCGPSTEIFFWTGDNKAPEVYDSEDERWIEIWNNVFITYNRKKDGSLEQLKQKNVDTGMGLERTLTAISGVKSAYETDLFLPIIKKLEELSGKTYADEQKNMRVIADHIRASVFLIGDENSVVPSNVDAGYILRRLIRKLIRLAKLIGIENNFTKSLAEIVIENYKDQYSELENNKDKILRELDAEEVKFEKTLEKGLKQFEKLANKDIDGKNSFLLFQSYGFPIEMIEELAQEKNIHVDVAGFHQEFKKHQELSRVGAEKKFKGGLSDNSEETIKLHTATHLLNAALRKVLSNDIKQKGSNITQERLRFDFNFPRKVTPEELKQVEDLINEQIQKALSVTKEKMELEDALKSGAQSEFGAKYPAEVWVYSIGDFSKEICIGPHVENTKELGKFKIKKEQSSAAGIRRIKAVLLEE